ncbi:MAG: 50S ribosomal protein L31 [Endomicrobiales bacterium]|nr:50S ribosomal protein L31 [Endomicrobiales bacterium]
MKEGIHPKYVESTVTCVCGNTFKTRSTKPQIKLDICSNCHPFFTGKQKIVDTAGRVERFKKRFAKTEGKTVKKKASHKKRAIKRPKGKILSTSHVRKKTTAKKEAKNPK